VILHASPIIATKQGAVKRLAKKRSGFASPS
jgi:hypothetical protein